MNGSHEGKTRAGGIFIGSVSPLLIDAPRPSSQPLRTTSSESTGKDCGGLKRSVETSPMKIYIDTLIYRTHIGRTGCKLGLRSNEGRRLISACRGTSGSFSRWAAYGRCAAGGRWRGLWGWRPVWATAGQDGALCVAARRLKMRSPRDILVFASYFTSVIFVRVQDTICMVPMYCSHSVWGWNRGLEPGLSVRLTPT